jgi:hypothetical protein
MEESMANDIGNFKSWFEDVLRDLYPRHEAGLAILLISFPILERYLRQMANISLNHKVTKEAGMKELLKLLPELNSTKDARKFWNIYRNGLLHTLTFREDYSGVPFRSGGASHDISDILTKKGKDYWIHPVKFARHIVSAVESNFKTFQGDPNAKSSLPKIVPLEDSTAGTNGPGITQVERSFHGTH